MDDLLPESRALYELLKVESEEEYERRFAAYKLEMMELMRPFVADTTKQIKAVNSTVASIQTTVSADLVAVKAQIGDELELVRRTLTSEISQLAARFGRDSRLDPGAVAEDLRTSHARGPGGDTAGPDGHRSDHTNRGTTCVHHMSSPIGGTNSGRIFFSCSSSGNSSGNNTDSSHGPRVELPQFDGANPKLWPQANNAARIIFRGGKLRKRCGLPLRQITSLELQQLGWSPISSSILVQCGLSSFVLSWRDLAAISISSLSVV